MDQLQSIKHLHSQNAYGKMSMHFVRVCFVFVPHLHLYEFSAGSAVPPSVTNVGCWNTLKRASTSLYLKRCTVIGHSLHSTLCPSLTAGRGNQTTLHNSHTLYMYILGICSGPRASIMMYMRIHTCNSTKLAVTVYTCAYMYVR